MQKSARAVNRTSRGPVERERRCVRQAAATPQRCWSIVAGATDLRLRVSRSGERSTHRIAAASYWSSSRLPVNQNPPVAKCSPRFHCSAARRGPNPVREYRHRPGARSSLPGADSHPSEAAAGRQGRCREELCLQSSPLPRSTAQPTCRALPIDVEQLSSGRQMGPQPRSSRVVQSSTAIG
jgi:hypothetical protein